MGVMLCVGLMVILVGAELFTNGVEWLGHRLKLSEGTVGNLLAAVGTALPESIVPLVAFCKGGEVAMDIGMGAILGAPFMLGTLAMFVTGFGAWLFRGRRTGRRILHVEAAAVSRELVFFLSMYLLAIGAAFLPDSLRPLVAVALVTGYGWYGWHSLHSGAEVSEAGLHRLYLSRGKPSLAIIVVQLALGLGAIISGARLLITGVEIAAASWGIHPLVLSLILAPIATELPEKCNSLLWVAQGKDRLALGNLTGAMAFQSTVIPAMGMLCSDWTMHLACGVSSLFLVLTVGLLWLQIRQSRCVSMMALMGCGVGYLGFLTAMLWSLG